MEKKTNLQDIIKLFITEHEIEPDKAQAFANVFFETIIEGLEQDGIVKIKGLGTFKLVTVEPRESINVNTGERIEIPSYTKISFTPENVLRERINKPFEHFETVILNDETILDQEVEEPKEEEKEDEIVPLVANATLSNFVNDEIKDPEDMNTEEEPLEKQDETDEVEVTENEETNEDSESIEETPEEQENLVATKDPKKPTTSKAQNYLIALIVVVLLLCGLVLLFLYYPDLFCSRSSSNKQPVVEDIEQYSEQSTIPLDSIESGKETKDTIKVDSAKGSLQVDTISALNPRSQSLVPVRPDSTSYDIVGTKTTYTLKPGETLIRVSLRFYNTKDLWPYLYKYNQDRIKNPDVVPTGTTLKIPELRKKNI